jgi:hypothetical protein
MIRGRLVARAGDDDSAYPGKADPETGRFSVVAELLDGCAALISTLYAMGCVQVTEMADFAFSIAAVPALSACVGAETWQPASTVAVMLNEAVAVAASADLQTGPGTRKPKAKTDNTNLVNIALHPFREQFLKVSLSAILGES